MKIIVYNSVCVGYVALHRIDQKINKSLLVQLLNYSGLAIKPCCIHPAKSVSTRNVLWVTTLKNNIPFMNAGLQNVVHMLIMLKMQPSAFIERQIFFKISGSQTPGPPLGRRQLPLQIRYTIATFFQAKCLRHSVHNQ